MKFDVFRLWAKEQVQMIKLLDMFWFNFMVVMTSKFSNHYWYYFCFALLLVAETETVVSAPLSVHGLIQRETSLTLRM